MAQRKIPFSYSRGDASDFPLRLYYDLERAGAEAWIDQLNIAGGKRWDREISKALKASQCILFIMSEKAVESDNVLDEVYYGLDEKKEVVPVLSSQCDVPYRVRPYNR